jgi:predicted nucleotidyltransferase
MYSYRMKKPADVPAKVRDYVDEVLKIAKERSLEIVSIAVFGSVAKGGFSQSVSDVDLIVALADKVPQKAKGLITSDLADLELKHGLREHPKSKTEFVYSQIDRMAGQFKSHFVCYACDLLAGNSSAVFGWHPLAEPFFSTRIGFANIVTSAKTIWGADLLKQAHVPPVRKWHLTNNCLSFLSLNGIAFLTFPILPNATKYSMSVMKWMIHNCHFCYTLKAATLEEGVEFFRAKLEHNKALLELLSLRREYRPSLKFVMECFHAIVHLYVMTVRENRFPIKIEPR